MERVENLCAITSIILLAAGLSTPYLIPNTGWTITWGAHTYFAATLRMPLFGIAALFCLFACLYSFRYIPFNMSIVLWHFWLSLGCVVWCVIGQTVFYLVALGETSGPLGLTGQALVLSFLATIPVFLATQLFFAFALAHALIKMRLP